MNGPAGFDPIAGILRTELRPGAGIDMTGGTVSVITPPDGVPYVAGDGVFINGATIGADLTGGYRMEIVSGSTIGQQRYFPIETVTGSSVTLQAGHAYKVYATSTAITLNTETVPDGKFGLEGHLEIFVAGTGYVVTGTNVVLAQPLEPDSVNNCTVRFHDGLAIISVEDHVAGYIVVNGSTAGDGSLYYGISTSTNDYVAFDASLNRTVIPITGAIAEGEKHIVGNGYTETTLTGAVDCGTSKFTVANLGLNNVQIMGGTLTLGDAYIPSGSTVAVSGGGLAVEKVTGAGSESVINLGNTHISNGNYAKYSVSGCTITGGNGGYEGGAFVVGTSSTAELYNCVVSGNSASRGGAFSVYYYSTLTLTSCTISGNSASNAPGAYLYGNSILNLEDGTSVSDWMMTEQNASMRVNGNVKFTTAIWGAGSVTLTSGAVLDLTGNTNATPIAPAGGITFEQGGAIVYPSAGSASAAFLDNVKVEYITNSNGISLPETTQTITGGATVILSGVNIEAHQNNFFGFYLSSGSLKFENVTFAANGGVIQYKGTASYCSVELRGSCAFWTYTDSNSNNNGAVVTISDGATLDFTSCTTIGVLRGGLNGGITVGENVTCIPYGGGSAVPINAGTYSVINRDGTTA